MIIDNEFYVIFDIDGTLADITHRLHFIKPDDNRGKDWHSFNETMAFDDPKHEIIKLNHIIGCEAFNIAIVTGRFEKYRQRTVEWLGRHNIMYNPDELYMRPDGDFDSDHIIKEKILKEQFLDKGKRIMFVVDDRQKVVDMWRKNGITCLQCQKGDY